LRPAGTVPWKNRFRVASESQGRGQKSLEQAEDRGSEFMDNDGFRPSRRAVLGAFAGICAVAAAPVYANVPGFLRGAGDVRRIRMYSQRTGEALDTIYFADGRYVPEALSEISYFARDSARRRPTGC
jgi:hypothetical protein